MGFYDDLNSDTFGWQPIDLAQWGGTGGFAGQYGPQNNPLAGIVSPDQYPDLSTASTTALHQPGATPAIPTSPLVLAPYDPKHPWVRGAALAMNGMGSPGRGAAKGPTDASGLPIPQYVYEPAQKLPEQGMWGNWLDNLATSLATTPLQAPNNFGGGLLSGFAAGFSTARLRKMHDREKLQKAMDDYAAKRNEANIEATADAAAARQKRLEDLRADIDKRRRDRADLLYKTTLEASVKANADGTFTLTEGEAKAMGAGYTAGQTVPKEIKVEALARTRPDKGGAGGKGGNGAPEMNDYTTLITRVQGDNDIQKFQVVRDGWATVRSAPDTAAGDLSLVYGFMKMLDPGSTVMQGEQATAQNAAGVPERVRTQYNNLLSGRRLGWNQRLDFLTTAQGVYRSRLPQLGRAVTQYRDLAKTYGLNPDLVVRNYQLESDPDVAPVKATPAEKGAKVAPAGSRLIKGPDGGTYIVAESDVAAAVAAGGVVVGGR